MCVCVCVCVCVRTHACLHTHTRARERKQVHTPRRLLLSEQRNYCRACQRNYQTGALLNRINKLAPCDMDITNCSRCLYLYGVRLFWYMAAIQCNTVELWCDIRVHYSNVRSVLNACQFRTLFGVGAGTLLPISVVSNTRVLLVNHFSPLRLRDGPAHSQLCT